MLRYGVYAMGAVLTVSSSMQLPSAEAASQQAPLLSGVDMQYVDRSVRPQDDLYRYLNGKWLDTFQLPPDKGSYGSFTYVYDATLEQLRGIVEAGAASSDTDGGKIPG